MEGAFALVDCLGWKGIWNRLDSKGRKVTTRQILQKVKKIQDQITESTQTLKFGYKTFRVKVKPRVLFLSDTVVLSVPPVEHDEQDISDEIKGSLAVEMASILLTRIIDTFLEDEPYLTVRGCLTYGEHTVSRNYILGPAVDEAADNYEISQGAFVWLHPKVTSKLEELWKWKDPYFQKAKLDALNQFSSDDAELVHKYLDILYNPPFLIQDYSMPLKGGDSFICSIVNPLFLIRDSDQRAKTIDRYVTSFDRATIDVLLKKQHTVSFLSTAADATLAFYENTFDPEFVEKLLETITPEPNNLSGP